MELRSKLSKMSQQTQTKFAWAVEGCTNTIESNRDRAWHMIATEIATGCDITDDVIGDIIEEAILNVIQESFSHQAKVLMVGMGKEICRTMHMSQRERDATGESLKSPALKSALEELKKEKG